MWKRESGRRFSYTYDTNPIGDGYRDERDLWYVPTGPNDPLVHLVMTLAQLSMSMLIHT